MRKILPETDHQEDSRLDCQPTAGPCRRDLSLSWLGLEHLGGRGLEGVGSYVVAAVQCPDSCVGDQQLVGRPMSVKRLARWFASLPLTLVAANSLMGGLVLSSTEAVGRNDWGHEALLLAVVPITHGWSRSAVLERNEKRTSGC